MWDTGAASASGNDDGNDGDGGYVRWSDRRRAVLLGDAVAASDEDDRDAAHLRQALLSPSTPEDHSAAARRRYRGAAAAAAVLNQHRSRSSNSNSPHGAPSPPAAAARSFHEASFSLARLFRGTASNRRRSEERTTISMEHQQQRAGRSWWLLGRDSSDDDDDDYYNNSVSQPHSASTAAEEHPGGGDEHNSSGAGWLSRYHGWIRRHRRLLLGFAAAVAAGGAGHAFPAYRQQTDSTFHRAVPGSPSAAAQQAFRRAYGGASNNSSNSSATTSNAVRDDALNPPLVLVLESVVVAAAGGSGTAISLTRDNSTVAYQQARNFSLQLLPYLQRRCWRWLPPPPPPLPLAAAVPANNSNTDNTASKKNGRNADGDDDGDRDNNNDKDDDDDDWLSVTSYYSVAEEDGLPWIADSGWTVRDGSLVLLEIAYTLPDNDNDDKQKNQDESELRQKRRKSTSNKQRVLHLMEAVDDYQREFLANATTPPSNNATTNSTAQRRRPYFTVHHTGIKYFAADLAASTERDLQRMDWTALPLALALLGAVLPSANAWVVWVVPVATMLTTVGVWSLVMRYAVCNIAASDGWTVSTFTPTVQMSLTLGMGVDYNLFLLARYLREMAEQPGRRSSRRRAVHRMLAGSGPVLVLSGAGLVFLPLGMLQSVGVGAAVTIVAALVVNLTVVPALLYTPVGLWVVRRKESSVQDDDDDGNNNSNSNTSNHHVVPLSNERRVLRFEEQQITTQSSEGDLNGDSHGDAGADALLEEPLLQTPHRRHLSAGDVNHDQQNRMPRSFWFRLSKHLLHPYRGIIILLLTCQLLLPVARHAGQLKSSISFDLLLPSKSPSLQTFHALGAKKGYGALNPYRILFDGHEANMTMTSSSAFGIMHLVLDELRAAERSSSAATTTTTDPRCLDERKPNEWLGNEGDEEQIELLTAQILDADRLGEPRDECASLNGRRPKRTSYNGIAVLKNVEIPYPVFVSAKYCAQRKPNCPIQLLRVLDAIDEQATSQDEYATFITATLGSSPFSDEGIAWLEAARERIERLEQEGVLWGVKVYVEGSAGIAHDAVDAVYRAFPTMAVLTIWVIFGVMGCFFRSIFAPIRSIVSISLTLAFSFGLAVCVFEEGAFNWTNIRVLTSIGDEVCWLVPIMAFSILIGLALDYDVFLISRVLEFRLEGNEHRSSIALGLDSTGGTIAAAGAIMAVAFGSLLFSSNPVLYQWSFILTTAVLVHTSFVEPLLVPILTSLSGKYCWWPRRLPEDQFCFSEFQERDYDDVAGLLRTLESSSEYEPLRRP